jgi:hypothetical protein
MLSNWGCSSSTGEDFTILSDALTAVVLPGNTFSVDSLLLPFLLMNSLFCLLAYISLRISWAFYHPLFPVATISRTPPLLHLTETLISRSAFHKYEIFL